MAQERIQFISNEFDSRFVKSLQSVRRWRCSVGSTESHQCHEHSQCFPCWCRSCMMYVTERHRETDGVSPARTPIGQIVLYWIAHPKRVKTIIIDCPIVHLDTCVRYTNASDKCVYVIRKHVAVCNSSWREWKILGILNSTSHATQTYVIIWNESAHHTRFLMGHRCR